MKLYEIDQAIERLVANSVDPETGEVVLNLDELNELQLQKEQKVENLALCIKNDLAEAKAIKDEEVALAARRKAREASADRAKKYLEFILAGEKFQTPRVAISYRTSTSVFVDEKFVSWAKRKGKIFLRTKEPEPDKRAIAEALKSGKVLPHAQLLTETNMTIK